MSFDQKNACMTQKVDEYGPYDAYCIRTKGHDGAHLYGPGIELEHNKQSQSDIHRLLFKFTVFKHQVDGLVYSKNNLRGPFVNKIDAEDYLVKSEVEEKMRKYQWWTLTARGEDVICTKQDNGDISVEVYVKETRA